MYQYHSPQSSSFREMKSSDVATVTAPTTNFESSELLSLFDKLTDTYPASFSSKMVQEQVSAPTSADVSPYMSEKECMEQPENEDPESPNNFNSKSRRTSLNKAERRAEHNAIERARRECLNSKFQQLAEALPNLQNHRRPSKGQIVEKALDWVKQNISKEDRYQYQIMQLQNENKRLMAQINVVHEKSSSNNSGIVTPPINTSSPSSSSFPASFHQQQFPATSTPIATTVDSQKNTSNNGGVKINHYHNQPEEMNMMYPMVPLAVEWQNQAAFVNHNNFECVMPSVSSSSSKMLHDDDNDSNSSADETHKQHMQMSYQDMSHCSFFEINQQQNVGAPWCKMQQHTQNTSYPMNYIPNNINTTNLNFGHHPPYLS